MLSEISQSQKDKDCIIPVIWVSEIIRLKEPEKRMTFVRGKWEVFHGLNFWLYKMQKRSVSIFNNTLLGT